MITQELLTLFLHAMRPRQSLAYDRYEPTEPYPPARHAVWAANLVLLLVIVGGDVTRS